MCNCTKQSFGIVDQLKLKLFFLLPPVFVALLKFILFLGQDLGQFTHFHSEDDQVEGSL